MKRISIIILFTTLPITVVFPQSKLHIKGQPQKSSSEIVAVRDANGNYCAALKILSDMDGFKYESYNGVVKVKDNPGEDIVYLSADERVLQVYRTGYKPLKIILSEYGIQLQKKDLWEIRIKSLSNVFIITDPKNVFISIDGSKFTNDKEYKLEYGKHNIYLKKFGYKIIQDVINIDDDNEAYKYKLKREDDIKSVIFSRIFSYSHIDTSRLSDDIENIDFEENEDNNKDIIKTISYYITQSYAIQKIIKEKWHIAPNLSILSAQFDSKYLPAIQYITYIISSYDADSIKSSYNTFYKSIVENLEVSDYFDYSRTNQSLILDEFKNRIAGNIPSPAKEILLKFSPKYISNQISLYSDGYKKRYVSDGSGESKGLKFHIDLPATWFLQKPNHKNIVIKSVDKYSNINKTILIQVMKHNQVVNKDFVKNNEFFIKNEMFLDNMQSITIKSMQIESYPAAYIETKINRTRIQVNTIFRIWKYMIFMDNYALSIAFIHPESIIYQEEEIVNHIENIKDKRRKMKNLFNLVVNSLTIDDSSVNGGY